MHADVGQLGTRTRLVPNWMAALSASGPSRMSSPVWLTRLGVAATAIASGWTVHVVVDNSKGADERFARDLARALGDAGFDVEVRPPRPQPSFDTSVHFIVEGVAVRVARDCSREQLRAVKRAIREAESQRSEHRRYRAVPIYAGDTPRVLEWVDIFET
jgi:hypothetical protein